MARKSRRNTETAAPQAIGQPMFSVGAYVRLSAVDRKHKGDSIETQQSIIGAFIDERPDLELTETYIDNGLTGQTFERPAFKRMLADLESGRINCCVSKDLSRLGRNSIDTGFYIEKYFPAHGVRYIAITDNYDSADGSGGGIMVSLKNLVNEAYALDIGRKIRATKQMNIRDGCFVGRFAPYGYLKSREDGHKLVLDPVAAPIVRRMFEMAIDGGNVSAALNWLNGSGILPPKRYFFSIGMASEKEARGNVHWNKGAIYSILKNRVYVGDMVQGKYKTFQHAQEKLPASDWVITENTHEPIVSRSMFEAAAGSLAAKYGKPRKAAAGEQKTENIFLRRIFCGHCGYAMHRTRNKGGSYSFKCDTRHNYGKDDCVQVSIKEEGLKSALLEMLREKAESPVGGDGIASAPAPSAESAELRGAQAELDRNGTFLKGLYESLVSGDIDDGEYRELKAGYEARIADLAEKTRLLREKERLSALESAKRGKAAAGLRSVRRTSELTAELLGRLVERILIYGDKRIEARLKLADETVVLGGAGQ